MRRYGFLAACAAFALGTAGAAADSDMDYGVPPPSPGESAHEVYDWSGAYFGVAGGWLYGEDEAAMSGALEGGPTAYETDGFAVGGLAGFNLQSGFFVYGGELDAEYADLSGGLAEGDASVTKSTDIMGSLRGRVGVAWDRFHLYGTGGLAAGHVEMEAAIAGETPVALSAGETVFGYTFGGGLEVGIWDNLSAGIEYRYTDLGDTEHSGEFVEGDLFFTHSNTFHAVRARLVWRLAL